MVDKNKDGLIPGQQVDFETLMRIKKQKKVTENERPEQVTTATPRKRRGKTKASSANK